MCRRRCWRRPCGRRPKKKRGIEVVGVRRRATGVALTRPPCAGGTRDNDADFLSRPAPPNEPFGLLAAHQTASTKDLFSVENPFSFDSDSDKIYSLLVHRAVSGNILFELLADRRSCDGPFLPSSASLAGDAPTSHPGNCSCCDRPQCKRNNNGGRDLGG